MPRRKTLKDTFNELKEGSESQGRLEERLIATLPYLSLSENTDRNDINFILEHMRDNHHLFLDKDRQEIFYKGVREIKQNTRTFFSVNDPEWQRLALKANMQVGDYYEYLNNYYDGQTWSDVRLMFQNLIRNVEIKDIIQSFTNHYRDQNLDDPQVAKTYQVELEGKLEQIFRIQGHSAEWIYDTLNKLYDKRIEATNAGHIMSLGYPKIDEKLHQGGVLPGDLMIIGARPAVGKTALLANIASNVSKLKIDKNIKEDSVEKKIANRYRIAFFSLEMRKDQINDRITAINTGIKTRDLIHPNDIDMAIVNKWLEVVHDQRQEIYVDDSTDIDVSDIETTLKQAEADGQPFSLVLVDYLQLMNANQAIRDERVAISMASKGLKNLAKRYNVGVIALAQLSRNADHSGDDQNNITLSMLKGSGSIEQDADVVLMLSRDDFYDDSDNPVSVAKISIAKNRDGGSGMVKLKYLKEYQKMESASDQEIESLAPSQNHDKQDLQIGMENMERIKGNPLPEDPNAFKTIRKNPLLDKDFSK